MSDLALSEDPKVENAFHVLLTTSEGTVGIQTVSDGKELPVPVLYTSRDMTDEEVGRIIREALASD